MHVDTLCAARRRVGLATVRNGEGDGLVPGLPVACPVRQLLTASRVRLALLLLAVVVPALLGHAAAGLVAAPSLLALWLAGDLLALRRRIRTLLVAARRGSAAGAEIGDPGDADLRRVAELVQRATGQALAAGREAKAAAAALRESHETWRALIHASPLAVVVHAPDGTIRLWSRAAERLFGWREQEVLGRPDPLAPGPHQGEARRFLDRIFGGEHVFDVELVRQTADGRLVAVSASAAPVRDAGGRIDGALVLYADLTERKRTEQQLIRHREILFRSEKLADLGRLAAGVAHELRNPLTILEARLEMLKQSRPGPAGAKDAAAEHLAQAADAMERMKRIIEGLSLYSRPERAEPVLLDLRELLSGARELVMHQARASGVDVDVDVPISVPRVLGDRSRLTQILLNLATNAIEAMAQWGGRLTLRVRLERAGDAGRSAARAVIEVSDTGPGIPPDLLPRIWEAFYTTKPEGTGLGLSIVRSLVEEQPGMSITVDSVPGEGTTFRLGFPLVPAVTTARRH